MARGCSIPLQLLTAPRQSRSGASQWGKGQAESAVSASLSTNWAPRQEISHSITKKIYILGTGKELQRARRKVWRGPGAAMAENV